MPITTRLTAAGTYFVNGTFDETTWTPAELGSSLGLWLDAADAGTVSLNGSTVSQWRDKSGKNRHVAQSTPSKQPTYTTAGQNGNNVLTFNSAALQSLFAPTSTINISQPFTRFVVGQFLTKSIMSVMLDSESANDQCVFYNGETGSTSWNVANGFAPASFAFFTYGTTDFLNHLHFHTVNGASSTWGIDGSTPVTATNSPGPRGQLGIRIGNIRAEISPAYAFNGRVFEVILIEGVISATDRQRVEGYLAWKWGLQSNLPVDHPYRSTPLSSGRNRIGTDTVFTAELDEVTSLAWNPQYLFNNNEQGVWYDPSDLTTLFQDTTGTVACTMPGNGIVMPVGRILDKSGRGNHLIANNNSTARPELSARVNLLTGTDVLSTQSVTTPATNYTLYFEGTGNIILSGTATGTYTSGINTFNCSTGTLTLTVAGTVTTADLRPTNTNSGFNLPMYQRVIDSTNYDVSGFPLYLFFDGANNSMSTINTLNLSGTDKLTAFAGVRKLTNSTIGVIYELSTNASSSSGSSFFSTGPASTALDKYVFLSRGTSNGISRAQSTVYNSPITNILSGNGDISGDISRLRINGVQIDLSTSDQGTGNFGNHTLFVGARNNSSLWFNGHLYNLIIRGSSTDEADIIKAEGWISEKVWLTPSINIGVAKRELSTGVLQVANEFDEFTGAPIVDNNLRVWVDAAQTSSYSGSGSTWNNLSPATGSFTLFNSPTFDGNNAGGELTFLPASLQYADNGTNLGNMSNFTVEAWAKVTASLTGQITAIICNQYNLTSALNFSIGTNNAPTDYNICVGFFDGAWRNTTGFNPTLNQWYHFVGTYNGSVLRYYINGSQNSFLNYSGTPSSGGSIRIARRWDSPDNVSANFFPGEVGVCRIYNRALTADEVLTNFYAHRNRYGA